jgi:hypothetical protein
MTSHRQRVNAKLLAKWDALVEDPAILTALATDLYQVTLAATSVHKVTWRRIQILCADKGGRHQVSFCWPWGPEYMG